MLVDLELEPFPVAIELASVVRLDFLPDKPTPESPMPEPVGNKEGADAECAVEFLEIGLGCSLVKGDGRAASRAIPPLRGRTGEVGDSAGDIPGERGGDSDSAGAVAHALVLDEAVRPLPLVEPVVSWLSI